MCRCLRGVGLSLGRKRSLLVLYRSVFSCASQIKPRPSHSGSIGSGAREGQHAVWTDGGFRSEWVMARLEGNRLSIKPPRQA